MYVTEQAGHFPPSYYETHGLVYAAQITEIILLESDSTSTS